MSELLITSSIDPIKEGQVFEGVPLPRHVTIWQYFTLRDDYTEEFTVEAGKAIEGFSPYEIMGTGEALFGPREDTPVRKIVEYGRGMTLLALHSTLGSVINRYEGQVRNPEWTYQGYTPHVTYVDGKTFDATEYARLDTVELIEKQPTGAKVVRTVWGLEEA